MEIRKEIKWFAQEMEIILKRKDREKYSDGWYDEDWEYLFDRLKEETKELEKVLSKRNWSEKTRKQIVKECGDIGNFAMMIGDNVHSGRGG